MSLKKYCTANRCICFLYYALFLTFGISLILIQPFGGPPDEALRFLVAKYVCLHGTIPSGYEPSILIPGYGGSYAFQPILSYILMGWVMRFLTLFHASEALLLFAARCANLLFGLLMAYWVRKIAVLLFSSESGRWLFCFLVMFLPENIFMHTYVNTDSMALLASAVILYSWLSMLLRGPSRTACVQMAVGITLCAMSYYNAYGYILVSILIFPFFYLLPEERADKSTPVRRFRTGLFFRHCALTALLSLAGSLWWFIRSFLLYHGDFLGLSARTAYAVKTADAAHNPLTRVTFYSSGRSLTDLLFHSDFSIRTFNSFLAMFGPASISSTIWLYRFYKLLLPLGLLCFILLSARKKEIFSPGFQAFSIRLRFELAAGLSALIVFGLGLWYNYTFDYQPQGRYFLPLLIPAMYFVSTGILKLCAFLRTDRPLQKKFRSAVPVTLCCLIVFFTALTVFVYVIPYYLGCYSKAQFDWIIHHMVFLPF